MIATENIESLKHNNHNHNQNNQNNQIMPHKNNYDLNDIFNFYDNLRNTLEHEQMISLLEYERFKIYQNFIEKEISHTNISSENSTLTLSEDKIIIQQIKKMSEIILSLIKGKLEFEFIYDYFAGQSNQSFKMFSSFGKLGLNLEMQDLVKEDQTQEEEESYMHSMHSNKFDPSSGSSSNEKEFEVFLKVIESLSRNELNSNQMNSIFDLLPLTSTEFLKNKVKLDDEEISEIKGKNEQYDQGEENSNKVLEEKKANEAPIEEKVEKSEKNEKTEKTEKSENLLENILKTSYKSNKEKASNKDHQKTHNPSIDKELEEDLNNEIFSYTRNMKHYATSFNEVLQRDNKKLDTIEQNQEGSKTKTEKSMKSLKEFSSSIRIGFFKLLLMLIGVGVTFMLTLLTIRIFPKLA